MNLAVRKLQTTARAMLRIQNWGDYILDCTGLMPHKNIFYTLRDGTSFQARGGTMDRVVLNEVWLRRIYSQPGFEIGKDDIVVDIGAHIGFFSVLAAQRAKRVLSFEPNPDNFDLLTENLKRNGLENCRAYQLGVAGTDGRMMLYLNQNNTGGHTLYGPPTSREVVSIETVTLAGIFNRYSLEKIDFLKVDCEGAEYEIFRSISPDMWRKIRTIGMECHTVGDGKEPGVIVDMLKQHGFVVVVKISPDEPELAMIYAKREYLD